jgi:hypothetical protein
MSDLSKAERAMLRQFEANRKEAIATRQRAEDRGRKAFRTGLTEMTNNKRQPTKAESAIAKAERKAFNELQRKEERRNRQIRKP